MTKRRENTTRIEVALAVQEELRRLKRSPRETYNEVIDRLIEDQPELSPAFKRQLEKSLKEVKAGRFYTMDQVRAKLGL